LPPLAGFFGKFYLFSAAMRADADSGLLWLVALALFGSLISLYYYLIVLKVIFVEDARTAAIPEVNPARGIISTGEFLQKMSVTVLAMVVLFLGLFPATLLARIIATLP